MKKKRFHFLWYILFGLIYMLASSMIILCVWYCRTFNVGFRELLYTLDLIAGWQDEGRFSGAWPDASWCASCCRNAG